MQDDNNPLEKEKDSSGFSRRNFLKGASVTALAAMASGEVGAAAAPAIGPGPLALELKINRTVQKVFVEPSATLAETLRLQLGLTGTKVACDRGSCSACTVWLDGTPVCACMTLAVDVGNREITTIEGLASGDCLHPVQQSFIDKDAMMCGYCTPGMVMSCAALLEHNHSPSAADVCKAVSGNYCRCGSYPKVIEATLAAADARKGGKSNG
jgi:xanthine dehydrogenase YagT iron-sulfur-binding subunit